jgi:ankyrin repeat protein
MAGEMIGSSVARRADPPRRRPRTPLAAMLGIAALAALGGATARAQINLFGSYYDNVARAAKQNDPGTVRLLIGNGANPNQSDEESRTGMHYGAMSGNLRIIAILIKAGAKLDPKEKLGNTPLHLAVERDQAEAARLLLDAGAAVDPESKSGMTPLMVAASRGNVEIVNALLAKGANVAKTDYTGRDAAGWATESHRPAVIQAIKRAQSAKKS